MHWGTYVEWLGAMYIITNGSSFLTIVRILQTQNQLASNRFP